MIGCTRESIISPRIWGHLLSCAGEHEIGFEDAGRRRRRTLTRTRPTGPLAHSDVTARLLLSMAGKSIISANLQLFTVHREKHFRRLVGSSPMFHFSGDQASGSAIVDVASRMFSGPPFGGQTPAA
jgi:hypothetical protein